MSFNKSLVDHIKENHHRFHFFFVLIVATSISFLFTIFSLAPQNARAVINEPALPSTAGPSCQILAGATGLRYFGFFGSSFADLPSAFDEVQNFVNIDWVRPIGGPEHLPFIISEMDKIRSSGHKAVFDIVGMWASGGNDPDPAVWNDWWYNFVVPTLQPYYNSGNILGFSLADDFWRISENEARRQMQVIKASFPEALNIAIFAYPGNVVVYPELDWVGMEMYQGHAQSDNDSRSTAYWQTWLDGAATLMTANQKFLLVPGVGGSIVISEDTTYLEAVLGLVTNNTRVAAILPFIWQDPGGVRSLPNYRSRLTALGGCFRRTILPDNPPIGQLDVADCASISGWAFDQDTPSTSINVHLYNGPYGAGGVFLGSYPTNVLRTDVNTAYNINGNHGFNIPTPVSFSGSIYIYGINSNSSGSNVAINGSSISLACSAPPPTPSGVPLPTPTPTPTSTLIPTPISTITPTPSGGATPSPGPGPQSVFDNITYTSIIRIFSRLACYVVRFGIIAFGIAIIGSGIAFVMSRGNPVVYANAKKFLLYSIVGGLVIYGVYTIILSISLFVTGSTSLPWIPLVCS